MLPVIVLFASTVMFLAGIFGYLTVSAEQSTRHN